MSTFNLTAQLNLRGPSNVRQIAADIKKQLGTITGDVTLKINASSTKNITQINSALVSLNDNLKQVQVNANAAASAISSFANAANSVNKVTANTSKQISNVSAATNKLSQTQSKVSKTISESTSEMQEFGKQSALAVRRFAAFSGATGVILGLSNAIRGGISSFIEYDKEFVKLQQVTDKSSSELKGLDAEIRKLSVGLGVSSTSLIQVSSTLAQAGLSAKETQQALRALALTDLAPSFDSLNETVEGSIALMRQFSITSSELERALGSVNAVAAAFAVEASDLISAIQRTGGVFASASKGVSEGTLALNEFLAVFTSIRQTTRESAETIATGLRTIFTRLQRSDTIEALREYGVTLTDVEGKFVGAYKAVELLSKGLSSIDPRDLRFSNIVEELGGFRQIGKVIPLIQQFGVAQQALSVAQKGQGSLARDAVTAQLSLANQISKVREEFLSLMRSIGSSDTFQGIAKSALGFASVLLKVADSVKGLLPLLAIDVLGKLGKGLGEFGTGFVGGLFKGGSGGGGQQQIKPQVPSIVSSGSQNRESLPANLFQDLAMLDDILRQNNTAINNLGNNISLLSTSLGSINSFSAAVQSNTLSLTSNTTSIDALTQAILGMPPPTTLNSGGIVKKFARGGVVPGVGNSDTVPAMLMPGEFVIRKKAVETIGSDNLHNMNKYGGGGSIRGGRAGKRQRFGGGGKAPEPLDVVVDHVYDGDSPVVKFTPKASPYDTSSRLVGIDTFEIKSRQKWKKNLALEAKAFTAKQYTKGKNVTENFIKGYSQQTNKERSGRPLFVDDNLKQNLIDEGLGFSYSGTGPKRAETITKAEYLSLPEGKKNKKLIEQDPKKFNKKNLGGIIQKFMAGGKTEPVPFGTGATKFPKRISNLYDREMRDKVLKAKSDEIFGGGMFDIPKDERINIDENKASEEFSKLFDRQKFMGSFKSKITRNSLYGSLTDFAKFIGLPSEDLSKVLPQSIDFGGEGMKTGMIGAFFKDSFGSRGYDNLDLSSYGFSTADEQDLYGYQKLLQEKNKEVTKITKTPVRKFDDGSFSYDEKAYRKAYDEKSVIQEQISKVMDKRANAQKAAMNARKQTAESTGKGVVGIGGDFGGRFPAKNDTLYHELTHQLFKSLKLKQSDSFTKYSDRVGQLFDSDNDSLSDAFDSLPGASYSSADVVYGRYYKNAYLGQALRNNRSESIKAGRDLNPDLSEEGHLTLNKSEGIKKAREYKPINPQINKLLLAGGIKQESIDRAEDSGKEEFLTTLVQTAPTLDSNMEGILDSTLNELLGNAGIKRQQYADGGSVKKMMAGGLAKSEKEIFKTSPTPMLKSVLARIEENPKSKNYLFGEYQQRLANSLNLAYKGVLMPGTNPSKEPVTPDTVVSAYDEYGNSGYINTTVKALEDDLKYITGGGDTGKKSLKKRGRVEVGDMLDTIRSYQSLGLDYVLNSALNNNRTNETLAEYMGEDLPENYKTSGLGDIKLDQLVKNMTAAAQYKFPDTLYSGLGDSKLNEILSQTGINENSSSEDLIGKTFNMPSFLSASEMENAAVSFARVGMLKIKTNPKKRGIIPETSKETTIDRSSAGNRKDRILQTLADKGSKGFMGLSVGDSYADAYDTEGEHIFPPNSKFKVLSVDSKRSKLFKKEEEDYRNVDMTVQQLAQGGKVTRNLGYIDFDVINDPANAQVVEDSMKKAGVDGPRNYTEYLTNLAIKARKEKNLQSLKALYGVAGAGKSSIVTGRGSNDSGTLRQTNRFPILTPDDITKASEVMLLTSTVSQDKLEGMLQEVDRAYTLSSTTKEEKDRILKQRTMRDVSGVGLFGRKAGSTTGAALDTAKEEALLEDRLGSKSVVLGRKEDGGLRRKTGNELVQATKKKLAFTWGGFAPTTAGHESIMEASKAAGIPYEDFIALVGSDEAVDAENYRTAVFDKDFRLALAKAGFGSKGASVLPKAFGDMSVPLAFDMGEKDGRRQVTLAGEGSMAFVADKTEKQMEKYKKAGYGVSNLERTGGISGTQVRDLVLNGNLKGLQQVVSPSVFSLLKGNMIQLQNRSNVLPTLIEQAEAAYKKEVSGIDQQLLATGITRADNKKAETDPEYAAQLELYQSLKDKKKKLQTKKSFEPYRLLRQLADKDPAKYGLRFDTDSLGSASGPSSAIQQAILAKVTKETSVKKSSGILPAQGSEILKRFGDERLPTDGSFGPFSGKTVRDTADGGKLKYWNSAFRPETKADKLAYYTATRDYLIDKFNQSQGTKSAQALSDTTSAVLSSQQLGLVGLNPLGYTGLLGPETWNLGTDPSGQERSIDASIVQRGLPTQYKSVIDYLGGQTEEIVGGASKLLGIEPKKLSKKQRETLGQGNIEGALLEQIFGSAGADILDDALRTRPIDFPMGIGPKAANIFGIDPDIPTEVKRTIDSNSRGKAVEEFQRYFRQQYGIPDPEKEVVKLAGGGLLQKYGEIFPDKKSMGPFKEMVFDFDDTLVSGGEIRLPDGRLDLSRKDDIPLVQEMLKKGKLTPLGQYLSEAIKQEPSLVDNLSILSARNQNQAGILAQTLQNLGLPIPESKIRGSDGPQNKQIKPYQKMIDDNLETITRLRSEDKEAIHYKFKDGGEVLDRYKEILSSILPQDFLTKEGLLKTKSGAGESIDIVPPEKKNPLTGMLSKLFGSSKEKQQKGGATYSGGLQYKILRKTVQEAKSVLPESEYTALMEYVQQNLLFEGNEDTIDLSQQKRPGSLAHETFHDIQGHLLDYYPDIYKKLQAGVETEKESITEWYKDKSSSKWTTDTDYQLHHIFPESITDSPYSNTMIKDAMKFSNKRLKSGIIPMSEQFHGVVYQETQKELGRVEAIPVLMAAASEGNAGARTILSRIFANSGLNQDFDKALPKAQLFASGGKALGLEDTDMSSLVSAMYGSAGSMARSWQGAGLTEGIPESTIGAAGASGLQKSQEKKPKNYSKIGLRSDGSEITATYFKNNDRQGFVSAKKATGNLFTVGLSKATQGYGPRLYDIVMEAATAAGGMLTSDRNQVSESAKSVWSYYFNNRSDVKKTPLDPSQWTKNHNYLDPKLYGRKETWPPSSDPAWILQSGYNKSADLINSPDVIDMNDPKYAEHVRAQQLSFLSRNNGGSIRKFAVGGSSKDTVPALLTPGEFVINKESAQRIGYGKLGELNRADKIQGYNKGGIVGVKRFEVGGSVGSDGRSLQEKRFSSLAKQSEVNNLEQQRRSSTDPAEIAKFTKEILDLTSEITVLNTDISLINQRFITLNSQIDVFGQNIIDAGKDLRDNISKKFESITGKKPSDIKIEEIAARAQKTGGKVMTDKGSIDLTAEIKKLIDSQNILEKSKEERSDKFGLARKNEDFDISKKDFISGKETEIASEEINKKALERQKSSPYTSDSERILLSDQIKQSSDKIDKLNLSIESAKKAYDMISSGVKSTAAAEVAAQEELRTAEQKLVDALKLRITDWDSLNDNRKAQIIDQVSNTGSIKTTSGGRLDFTAEKDSLNKAKDSLKTAQDQKQSSASQFQVVNGGDPLNPAAKSAADALEYFSLQAEYYGISVAKYQKNLQQQIVERTLSLKQEIPTSINRFRSRVSEVSSRLSLGEDDEKQTDARTQLSTMVQDITGELDSRKIESAITELERNLEAGMSFAGAINQTRELTSMFRSATDSGKQYERVLQEFSSATGVATSELSKVADIETVKAQENFNKISKSGEILASRIGTVSKALTIFSGFLSNVFAAKENRSLTQLDAGLQGGVGAAGQVATFGTSIFSAAKNISESTDLPGSVSGMAKGAVGFLTNPVTLGFAAVGVAAVGVAAALKDAANAAREFDIEQADKKIERSLSNLEEYFKDFADNMKDLSILDTIETELSKQAGLALSRIQLKSEVPKTFWLNLADSLGTGDARSAERSRILEKQGAGSYLESSQFSQNPVGFIVQGLTLGLADPLIKALTIGRAGLGVSENSASSQRANAIRNVYTSDAAPVLAQERSSSLMPIAENIIKIGEARLKSGEELSDVLKILGTSLNPSSEAQTLARSNPAVEEQIIRIKASNILTKAQQEEQIKIIIAMEAQNTAISRFSAIIKGIELEKLNKELKIFTTSISRMLNTVSMSMGKASFSIDRLYKSAELSSKALSGTAKIGEVAFKSINVLQNPRVYSMEERATAVNQASNMAPRPASGVVSSLLGIGETMERTVISTINRTIDNNDGATAESISGAVRAALNIALNDLGLPPELAEKLAKETQNAFASLRSGEDKNLSFAELVEQVPQFADAISSAKKAQEEAIKSLEFWQTQVNNYGKAMDQAMEYQLESNDRLRKSTDIRVKSEEDLARALGKPMRLSNQRDVDNDRTSSLTGGIINPAAISANIIRLDSIRSSQQSGFEQASTGGPENKIAIERMTRNLNLTTMALRENYTALKEMADSSNQASEALSKIGQLQQRNQAAQTIIEKLVTSNATEINRFNRSLGMLSRNMDGKINNSTTEERSQVLQTFNMIAPLLGDQQNPLKANVLESLLKESGIGINSLFRDVITSLRDPEADPVMREAINLYKDGISKQIEANKALSALSKLMSENTSKAAGDAIGKVLETKFDAQESLLTDIKNGIETLVKIAAGNPVPTKKASGGVVYADNGMFVNFQPKGTDTVPAMLTPGEFVVNRSATAKNLPLLKNINSGKTSYYADGGMVVDTRWAREDFAKDPINVAKQDRLSAKTKTDSVTSNQFLELKRTSGDVPKANQEVAAPPVSFFAIGNGTKYKDMELPDIGQTNSFNSVDAQAGSSYENIDSRNGISKGKTNALNSLTKFKTLGKIVDPAALDDIVGISKLKKINIPKIKVDEYREMYKKILVELKDVGALAKDDSENFKQQESDAKAFFRTNTQISKSLKPGRRRGVTNEVLELQNLLYNPDNQWMESVKYYSKNKPSVALASPEVFGFSGGKPTTYSDFSSTYVKQQAKDSTNTFDNKINSTVIYDNIKRLEDIRSNIYDSLQMIGKNKNDLEYIESEESAGKKAYISNLDDLFYGRIFKATFNNELFRKNPMGDEDIRLPVTLYNSDETSWNDYIKDLELLDNFKNKKSRDKKYAYKKENYIQAYPIDDRGVLTSLDKGYFPWTSAEFDDMGLSEKLGSKFKESSPEQVISVKQKEYGKSGSGKYSFIYNAIKGKMLNSKTGSFDGPFINYGVFDKINNQEYNPGSPFGDLPNGKILVGQDFNSILQTLEDYTPTYDKTTGLETASSKQPSFRYPFSMNLNSAGLKDTNSRVLQLLGNSSAYNSLGDDLKSYVLSSDNPSSFKTSLIKPYTIIADTYRKKREERKQDSKKGVIKEKTSEVTGDELFSLKTELKPEDKKAGLGQGDIESFSDEKRVTLARYFYDAYSGFFNIKSAKPTSLKSIATIANELDANMQKASIKKGGQEGEEFNRINALRAAFTSLYQPEETASYFKRLGFPLKNKEYNTPVPQPKDPAFPERTPVQYYEKILPNINNQMQLLLQREMDYSRAISNKDGPNRYDLYNRQKLKERLQEKTDNFSLTEIKDGDILQSSEKTKIAGFADVEKVALNPYNLPSKSSDRQQLLTELFNYYQNDRDKNGDLVWPAQRARSIGLQPALGDQTVVTAKNIDGMRPRAIRDWYSIQDNILNKDKTEEDLKKQKDELSKIDFQRSLMSIRNQSQQWSTYLTGNLFGLLPDFDYIANKIKLSTPKENAQQNPVDPNTLSRGGVVYASEGKYINFQPRGTDTVPAMLTPGEFVVNAQSTKANLGLLHSINRSQGGQVNYLSDGGIPTGRPRGRRRDPIDDVLSRFDEPGNRTEIQAPAPSINNATTLVTSGSGLSPGDAQAAKERAEIDRVRDKSRDWAYTAGGRTWTEYLGIPENGEEMAALGYGFTEKIIPGTLALLLGGIGFAAGAPLGPGAIATGAVAGYAGHALGQSINQMIWDLIPEPMKSDIEEKRKKYPRNYEAGKWIGFASEIAAGAKFGQVIEFASKEMIGKGLLRSGPKFLQKYAAQGSNIPLFKGHGYLEMGHEQKVRIVRNLENRVKAVVMKNSAKTDLEPVVHGGGAGYIEQARKAMGDAVDAGRAVKTNLNPKARYGDKGDPFRQTTAKGAKSPPRGMTGFNVTRAKVDEAIEDNVNYVLQNLDDLSSKWVQSGNKADLTSWLTARSKAGFLITNIESSVIDDGVINLMKTVDREKPELFDLMMEQLKANGHLDIISKLGSKKGLNWNDALNAYRDSFRTNIKGLESGVQDGSVTQKALDVALTMAETRFQEAAGLIGIVGTRAPASYIRGDVNGVVGESMALLTNEFFSNSTVMSATQASVLKEFMSIEAWALASRDKLGELGVAEAVHTVFPHDHDKHPHDATGHATGGLIYANEGQYINFQPKGTDTVPAMLTPGEFVVNRAATAKNLPLLRSINKNKGGQVSYFQEGGAVSPVTGLASADSNSLLLRLAKIESSSLSIQYSISDTLLHISEDIKNIKLYGPPSKSYIADAKSSGGIIYASNGQYVNFQPKGTDTVPAMLTPGEFVVNSRSTAKNLPLLKAINNSKGGDVKHLNDGGVVYAQNGIEVPSKSYVPFKTPKLKASNDRRMQVERVQEEKQIAAMFDRLRKQLNTQLSPTDNRAMFELQQRLRTSGYLEGKEQRKDAVMDNEEIKFALDMIDEYKRFQHSQIPVNNKFNTEAEQTRRRNTPQLPPPLPHLTPKSKQYGGYVAYASNGQLINFQPKGTDTVPAMLTPGEFVINKESTSKYFDLLKSINSGTYSRGDIVKKFSTGGDVKPNYYQFGSYVGSATNKKPDSFDFPRFMQKLIGQISSVIGEAIKQGLVSTNNTQNIDNRSNGVSVNIDTQVLDRINEFTNRLKSVADTLAGLSAIPSEIRITAKHDINIVINGDTVLNQLKPEISQLVMSELKNSFENLIAQNSPLPSDKLFNPFA